jgi:hypothetical protein
VIDERGERVFQAQLDKAAARFSRFLLAEQGFAADKAAGLVESDGKAEAAFEWSVFLADVMAPVAISFSMRSELSAK